MQEFFRIKVGWGERFDISLCRIASVIRFVQTSEPNGEGWSGFLDLLFVVGQSLPMPRVKQFVNFITLFPLCEFFSTSDPRYGYWNICCTWVMIVCHRFKRSMLPQLSHIVCRVPQKILTYDQIDDIGRGGDRSGVQWTCHRSSW